MGTFIADGASVLPPVKSDARPASGAVTEWAAADANKDRQALLDLRTQAIESINDIITLEAADVALAASIGAEAAARAAADAAIIAAGVPVALAGSSYVTPTGASTATTLSNLHAREYWVEDFGAIGNGVTDDYTAIHNCIAAAPAGSTIRFGPKVYAVSKGFTINKPLNLVGGPGTVMKLLANAAYPDFTTDGDVFFYIVSNFDGVSPLYASRAAIALGTDTFPCSDTSGLAAGDYVFCRLGGVAGQAECTYPSINVIKSIVPNTSITLVDATWADIPETVSIAGGIPTPNESKIYKLVPGYVLNENSVVDGFAFDRNGFIEGGEVAHVFTRNCIVRNITMIDVTAGCHAQECENMVYENIFQVFSDDTAHSAAGRYWGISGCTNVQIRNGWSMDVGNSAVFIEGNSRNVLMENLWFTATARSKATYINMLHLTGNSEQITVRKVKCHSDTAPRAFWGTGGGIADVTLEDCEASGACNFSSGNIPATRGDVIATPLSTTTRTLFRTRKPFTGKVYLTGGTTGGYGYLIPDGMITRLKVWTNAIDDAVTFQVVDSGGHGTAVTTLKQNVPNVTAIGTLTNLDAERTFTAQWLFFYTNNPLAEVSEGDLLFIEGEVLQAPTVDSTAVPAFANCDTPMAVFWRMKLAQGSNAITQTVDTSYPGGGGSTVGPFRKGDIVWNSNISAGAPQGWVCVTASVDSTDPGVWQSIPGSAALVANAAGATPTKAEFDALLASLKNAGVMRTS